MLRSELVFRFGVSSALSAWELRSSEFIAMDSRERGEPPLLCAEEADEYGDGGRSWIDVPSCEADVRIRDSYCGGGERDDRRRLRDCGLGGEVA